MSKLIALCAVLSAGAAFAQTYPVIAASQPYVPLAGATPVNFTARGGFSAPDEGFEEVQLGFTFPFFGTNFTSVFIDTNGFLSFGAGCTSGCLSPRQIPSNIAGTPHNIIAGWWDDLGSDTGSPGTVRYLKSSGQIAIEYSGWPEYFNSYTVTFTITLDSAGVITYSYGPQPTQSVIGKVASVGIEDATGATGVVHLPTCSSLTQFDPGCAVTDWPVTNNSISVGSPVQADLSVANVAVSNVVDNGTTLSLTVLPTFRNSGRTDANSFLWRAYLSTDRIKDGADVPLVISSGPLTALQQATVNGSAVGSAPSPGTGSYFILVEADFTNVVVEASEANNLGSTTAALIQGKDLVAQSISGPVASGPDTGVVLPIKFQNLGIQSAGAVGFKLYLSADDTFQLTDFQVFAGTRTVTGGQTINESISVTLPPNVPGGDFYWLLVVDPANAVAEVNEANNVVVSADKVNIKQADLVNGGVELFDPGTGAITRVAYFGEPSLFRFAISNVGGADAKNFKVGVAISKDANLSLLSDTLTGETDVALVAPGTATQLTVPFTMPLNDKDGMPFKTGTYFLYGVIDTRSNVAELGKANNNVLLAGPVTINAPSADLVVGRVDAPASAGVGELLPVFRELRNIGNRAAPAATYRYFASANPIVTDQDFALPIIAADGTSSIEGSLGLGVRASDGRSELVRLPNSMPAGTYYLGLIVDYGQQVPEFDETNNTAVSNQVVVAAASLRIGTNGLLDGAVGQPYQFRLAAEGPRAQ